MNDVQHFEAARALAERMLAEGGATPREPHRVGSIARSFRRRPTAEELALVGKALAKQLRRVPGRPGGREAGDSRRRIDAEERRAAERDGGLDDDRQPGAEPR